MFKHQGPSRSETQNQILAGYLAFLGGFVDATGFVILGRFTSHVTGNVVRSSAYLATHDPTAAVGAFAMVGAFFAGALLASFLVESSTPAVASGYARALLLEGGLLAGAAFAHPTTETALLCIAMGMQNSLVTRLSGAVVRTTHLTGVVTDIGIELARWIQWIRVPEGRERPSLAKLVLLLTIGFAFTVGAVIGALAALRFQHGVLVAPAVALLASSVYAWVTRNRD